MVKIYVDFDGVILDTWNVIFKEYITKIPMENCENPQKQIDRKPFSNI